MLVFRSAGRKTNIHEEIKYHAAVRPERVEGQAELPRAQILITIRCMMTAKKTKSNIPDHIADADAQPENTPHPWAEPSPEAKEAAEPAKTAVKEALSEIKSPAQAEHVAAEVI